jgi:hypothetical protein
MVGYKLQEPGMKPRVICEFWVEGNPDHLALLHPNDMTFESGDDINSLSHRLYPGSTNEDPRKRTLTLSRQCELHWGLEAVDLTSEGVAADDDIHRGKKGLIAFRSPRGEHDKAGAGAKDGVIRDESSQGTCETILFHQLPDGGAFAARDDESVQTLQLLRQSHLDRSCTQPLHHSNVFSEGALKCEYTDGHIGAIHLEDATTSRDVG